MVESAISGVLDARAALNLRRRLAAVYVSDASETDMYRTIPGCPIVQPAHPEYVVGFGESKERRAVVIERTCSSDASKEARKTLAELFELFPSPKVSAATFDET